MGTSFLQHLSLLRDTSYKSLAHSSTGMPLISHIRNLFVGCMREKTIFTFAKTKICLRNKNIYNNLSSEKENMREFERFRDVVFSSASGQCNQKQSMRILTNF